MNRKAGKRLHDPQSEWIQHLWRADSNVSFIRPPPVWQLAGQRPSLGGLFYGDGVMALKAVADLTPNKHVSYFPHHCSRCGMKVAYKGLPGHRSLVPHLHSEMAPQVPVTMLTTPTPLYLFPQIISHICLKSLNWPCDATRVQGEPLSFWETSVY